MSIIAGCSSVEKRPIADYICVYAKQENRQEEDYLHKYIRRYLNENGFTLATEKCDVTVRYQPFGALQSESETDYIFWSKRNNYWVQEGIANFEYHGKTTLEDHQIVEKGYAAKQDLLEGLAWAIVKPIIKTYRPSAPKLK
ncbi:MAG: hypothetical protein IPG93_00975 [Burkholderiales bacterium]|nr:hypothetical protein [Burkholderiales bacterium]